MFTLDWFYRVYGIIIRRVFVKVEIGGLVSLWRSFFFMFLGEGKVRGFFSKISGKKKEVLFL